MVLLESVYNDDGYTYLLFGEPLPSGLATIRDHKSEVKL